MFDRGDGIQARFIPEILDEISKNDKKKYILWGFEEPENSYEDRNIRSLRDEFVNKYSQNKQIFITTHSFNFLPLSNDSVSKYRIWKDKYSSSVVSSVDRAPSDLFVPGQEELLEKELGIFELTQQLEQVYLAYEKQRDMLCQMEDLLTKSRNKYILCVEGETDKELLETAWRKLEKSPFPFYIHNCFCANQIRTMLAREEVLKKHSGKIFIGLFDFDSAYQQWEGLSKKWTKVLTDEQKGLLRQKQNAFALLLPVPPERKSIASGRYTESFLEIELLFPDIVISKYAAKKELAGGGCVWNISSTVKNRINEDRESIKEEDYKNFIPLFEIFKKIKDGKYSV